MKNFLLIVFIASFVFMQGCEAQSQENKSKDAGRSKAKVIFIELGSVNCIPCKQMKPVMKAIEDKYGSQVKVVFYDVWKSDQKHYAQKYGIRLIPTQVFLDEHGKEFHRHEGFYPEEEIDKILKAKGLKPNNKKG
jgi:thioredoxin 1